MRRSRVRFLSPAPEKYPSKKADSLWIGFCFAAGQPPHWPASRLRCACQLLLVVRRSTQCCSKRSANPEGLIMNGRPIVRVGDKTTHGGTVTEGFSSYDVLGRAASG